MLAEKILRLSTNVLTPTERERYFEDGFLVLPDYVPTDWLRRLRAATAELIERSRVLTSTDAIYVLEEGHSAEQPRLHRVASPQDQHPVFWELFSSSLLTDLVADVVGPDVKFYQGKLNVKSEKGTRGFNLHQDIQGWPHTDFSPVTVGIYLDGCTPDQGPLQFLPGSHRGPIHSLYNDRHEFVQQIDPNVLAGLDISRMVSAVGGPGTTVLLNCRTIHGSAINTSSKARPLLLPVYSSADSFPYTSRPIPTPHQGDIVRGQPAQFASFDTTPCELPPDFRGGYKTAFEVQPGAMA